MDYTLLSMAVINSIRHISGRKQKKYKKKSRAHFHLNLRSSED